MTTCIRVLIEIAALPEFVGKGWREVYRVAGCMRHNGESVLVEWRPERQG